MKILVLAQSYPSNKSKNHMFIHVRNLYYLQNGADVVVLSFDTDSSYIYEGIKVITENDFIHEIGQYDVLVSHASNVRNSYRFLRKYDKQFSKMIFVFHGHEVLRLSEEYPQDFPYVSKNSAIKRLLQDGYDTIKFWIFRQYYKKVAGKSFYIFVSNWLRKKFYKNLKLKSIDLKEHDYVINNCVGKVFEDGEYKRSDEPKYDFITIRGNIDGSKYCVDIVNDLAKKNPGYKFLLIGSGKYFEYNRKATNITWINKQMNHSEMLDLISNSNFALMPTREDTQGVMTCELATYGIPTITSDIEVCREIFLPYPNVILIPNDIDAVDLSDVISKYKAKKNNHKFYTVDVTIAKEWDLILQK